MKKFSFLKCFVETLPVASESLVKTLRATSLLGMMVLAPMGASAQVTIGNGKVPENFSVLELISNNKMGLRLPQLTTAERDAVQSGFGALATTEAEGLQIFNLDTRCVETWNGIKWIGACANVLCSDIAASYNFCDVDNAKISDLNRKFDSSLEWFDVAEGGTALAPSALLEAKVYYAEGCVDADGQKSTVRVAVDVVACNAAPAVAANRITTFSNVMYDFQTQVLEAYTVGGGAATAWQWQVSKTRTGGYTDIAGATASTFKVPAHFIDGYAGATNDELFFKCAMSNPKGMALTSDDNALGIEFIKTNTAGYDNSIGTATPYLIIQRSTTGITGSEKDGTIKIALFNLGQSEDNDAGDLGDYYQWGRVKDGHQTAVWSKNASRANQIAPMTGGGATSEAVAYGTLAEPNVDANGQINATSTTWYGKFITNDVYPYDWSTATTANDRWGNGNRSRSTVSTNTNQYPGDIRGWVFPSNNPCPTGWRVPSTYEWYDIYRTSAEGAYFLDTSTPYDAANPANNNTWRWRDNDNNTYGGIIITNLAGEKVFLPALGYRNNTTENGRVSVPGSSGRYWTSVPNNAESAHRLYFTATAVAPNASNNRSRGFSVRCMAD